VCVRACVCVFVIDDWCGLAIRSQVLLAPQVEVPLRSCIRGPDAPKVGWIRLGWE
jgi:hypothetical protein